MTSCPTRGVLLCFLSQDGSLGPGLLDWIGTHIEGCRLCQVVLDELTACEYAADIPAESKLDIERIESLLFAHPELFSGPALADEVEQTAVPGRVGRFWLEEKLGAGGSSVVYRARDLLMECTVAVKIPRPQLVATPEGRRWFLDEARKAFALNAHKNVVKVVHLEDEGDFPFLVSEYCAGGSLDAWLRRSGPVDPALAALMVAQVADGVQHAHENGLLHRDIKAENVFLQPGGEPLPAALNSILRLGDLGLARRVGAVDPIGEEVHGTYGSMAPEQTGGRASEIGFTTDVYGLGALLYHMLTGVPPFGGVKLPVDTILEQIRATPPVPVRSHRPDIPRALAAIVHRCLAKIPAERYASAAALAADLHHFLKHEPTSNSPRWEHTLHAAARRPWRAGALLLVSAAAAAAYPVHRLGRRWEVDRALTELETVQVASLPRVLSNIDPADPHVAARLHTLFAREEPRSKYAAALALARLDPVARAYALDRWLRGPAADSPIVSTILLKQMPDLVARLESAAAPSAASEGGEDIDAYRANAAAALYALGSTSTGREMLRLRPDPQCRSFLIHRLGRGGVSARVLFARVRDEPDASIRRALILSLGEVPSAGWDGSLHDELAAWLLDRYENDPDAGIHGAAKWLLGRWAEGPGGDVIAERLAALDIKLAGISRPDFAWRLSPKHRITFVRLVLPTGATFEVADAEVTVGLFLKYKPEHRYLHEPCPTPNHPVNYVSYDQATAFCRWLSREEGLPEGWDYRPPTVNELIYASRAGATTSRYYGDAPQLLSCYASYRPGGIVLATPIASLKPNDFGLFDTMGNVSDLCTEVGAVAAPRGRALGGSAAHSSPHVSCDLRESNPDGLPMPNQGIRVARSFQASSS